MESALDKQKSELRSGITAPFNKSINEAYQFSPQMPFHIENSVVPSALIGVLKGDSGTPALPAAVSVVKDDNNLIMLATSPIERGKTTIVTLSTTFSVVGGETLTINISIPKGKKYILKALSYTSGNLVGTLSRTDIYAVEGSSQATLFSQTTGLTNGNLIIPQQIILNETQRIRFRFITSAWTSGQLTYSYIITEFDI